MRLYFIRHAQSSNNALYEATGAEVGRSDDPELSELGVRQAEHLGEYIAKANAGLEPGGFGLTHLYASPMVRAAHTASEIAQRNNLELELWADWHESGGIWLHNAEGERIGQPGKTRASLEQRFPGVRIPASLKPNGWWSRPSEPDDNLRPRAERVWQELLERHGGTNDRVAVVSHGHFYVHVMAQIFDLEVGRSKVWLQKHNTAITRIDHLENEFESTVLVYQNQVSHLPADLIS